LVAPIEFSMTREDFELLGGHMDSIIPLDEVLKRDALVKLDGE